MLAAQTLGIGIRRPWRAVYAAIWRPEAFPRWASGLSRGGLVPDGEAWRAEGAEGPVRIRFTPHNGFGVMDHAVELPGGQVVQVPMRVVANGDGAEVLMTLFRQPGMSDAKLAEDAAWMRRDLEALKAMLEAGT